MKTFLVRSPAKINICLNVVGKQPDGYHQLDMVILPLAMHDSMLFSEIRRGEDNFVTIDDYSMGPMTYNLATSAIEKLQAIKGFDNAFRVSIHKVIPMQSGLGGGSSNAALTLESAPENVSLAFVACSPKASSIAFANSLKLITPADANALISPVAIWDISSIPEILSFPFLPSSFTLAENSSVYVPAV